MQPRHLAGALLLPLSLAVSAADGGASYGRPDCRIAALSPVPTGQVDWSGACSGGFAEGPGTATWQGADGKTNQLKATLVRGAIEGEAALTFGSGVQYSGTFKNGVPDGKGYFRDPDGRQFEGEVRNGERTGTGVGISKEGDTYDGEWAHGVPEGRGHIDYVLGGSYEGQWNDGKRHGHGVLTYAGSGRRFEGEFVDGRIAGTPPPPKPVERFGMARQGGHSGIDDDFISNISVPPDAGYAAFTSAQKRLFNANYPALEEGDEPPYPLEGVDEFLRAMSSLAYRYRVHGTLYVYANVDATGKVGTVKMVGIEDPEFRRRVAATAAARKYKPAVCRGQPCPMRFPYAMRFKLP